MNVELGFLKQSIAHLVVVTISGFLTRLIEYGTFLLLTARSIRTPLHNIDVGLLGTLLQEVSDGILRRLPPAPAVPRVDFGGVEVHAVAELCFLLQPPHLFGKNLVILLPSLYAIPLGVQLLLYLLLSLLDAPFDIFEDGHVLDDCGQGVILQQVVLF